MGGYQCSCFCDREQGFTVIQELKPLPAKNKGQIKCNYETEAIYIEEQETSAEFIIALDSSIQKRKQLKEFECSLISVISQSNIPAIIKIQAIARGYITRQRLKKLNKRVIILRNKLGPFNYGECQDQEVLEYRPQMSIHKNMTYEGQWIQGTQIRQGKGTIYWTDGSMYEGWFKNNKAFGKGRLIHANGDFYEGEWVDDQANGHGKYQHFNNGTVYKGNWLNDQQSGFGQELFPDGTVYQGNYKNGTRHGKGKYIWTNGSSYQGDIFENCIQGRGIFTWENGRVYNGEWLNNKMEGNGILTYTDGKSYTGQFQKDRKHGYGIQTWPDGRKYQGKWFNGKEHDRYALYTNNQGFTRETQWRKGQIQQ